MPYRTSEIVLVLIGLTLIMALSSRADLSPSANQTPASSATVITSAATTAVKATGGTLRRIAVTTEVANATIKLFDIAGASCTGTPSTNPRGVLTLPAAISNPFTLELQEPFVNGICVLTSGATNLTVVFD